MNAATVWRLCLVCVIAGMLGLLITWQASAHSWFEYRCCSDKDCRTVPNGTVVGGPNGWEVRLPGAPMSVIPYNSNKVRPIPPEAPVEARGLFHVCTVQGKPTGMVLCIYVPDGGA